MGMSYRQEEEEETDGRSEREWGGMGFREQVPECAEEA